MKPFMHWDYTNPGASKAEATCEFCGKTIATMAGGKWTKIAPEKPKDSKGHQGKSE